MTKLELWLVGEFRRRRLAYYEESNLAAAQLVIENPERYPALTTWARLFLNGRNNQWQHQKSTSGKRTPRC
jgi:hypothetical protein